MSRAATTSHTRSSPSSRSFNVLSLILSERALKTAARSSTAAYPPDFAFLYKKYFIYYMDAPNVNVNLNNNYSPIIRPVKYFSYQQIRFIIYKLAVLDIVF